MPTPKAELILHPQRIRILQALIGRNLTTQEIADRLADLPKSSIYRHLKTLLDGGLVTVTATRPVKGVEEKVYQLTRRIDLGPEDMADLTTDDHLRYFAAFLGSLLHGFEEYLQRTPHPDPLADLVGYREAVFYATDQEFMDIARKFGAALLEFGHDTPAPGRKQHKLATITYPIVDPAPAPEENDGAA